MPAARPLRFISWNVNGIRSILKKGFHDFVVGQKPDVLCLQEVRAMPEQLLDVAWAEGYECIWNPAQKAGYSGTGVLTRISPVTVSRGIGTPEHDREGRVLTLEFADYFVVNCYTPNSQRELTRLEYRQDGTASF